ncbi:hypothetical protein AUEXF2481DRAFT_539820 [Aureobasidium subglaciale EXF-2481]|uniref:Uncharacterized protein n=1 Tax=Aureobasidium subglaciale (strain EXF-2481) TaxID=1043005 RepID=A0A074YIQ9_AURSE|nr:uncharacterized protein AUEXF2481DRAFT_539820 [Aureobasidium subglaciale EXF-2481]KEQ97658.1 hypothetical protein AUEXF2481DRAFT_539820 [Aureobasidium subglaciale EXF-2481]
MAECLEFVYLDVFTETPFKGNPLAIVHLPPPSTTHAALTQAQKQTIARELNLSETVFVQDLDKNLYGDQNLSVPPSIYKLLVWIPS